MRIAMKSIVILVTLFCVLIEAQNVGQNNRDSSQRRPNTFRRRLPVFNRNPVDSIEGGRDGTTQVKSGFQNILEAVRNRTTLAENRAKEQIKELRVHAIDTLTRLKTLDKQVLQLETYLKEVNDTFLATKQELNKEYTNQKTIIDNQIEGLGTEKSTVLEDESKRLDKKISDNINNKLVPQMRGLGDGFGRHL